MANSLFQQYQRHYEAGAAAAFASADDVRRYRLDRLPRWLNLVDRKARILDAGCATGYQLYLLADSGFSNLTGVDVSRELVEAARERLQDKAEIVMSDLGTYLGDLPPRTFDVILFHHVIEHVPAAALGPLLKAFHRVLTPGGRLSVRTPNANCLAAGSQLHGDATHVNYFNDRSLIQVLEAAGFDPAEISFSRRPPRLIFLPTDIKRSVGRLLNRWRWHLNQAFHGLVYALSDIKPITRSFDPELEACAAKQRDRGVLP